MRQTLSYVACYLMWTVSAILGVLDMLILRNLFQRIAVVAGVNRWVFGAIDKFLLLLLGLGWLIFAIASESYYRNGVGERNLVRRFGRVMAVELSVSAVGYVVPLLVR